ncbi:hypothetical protein M427DRAFT_56407 [Gonapodya prolifera JEL478]|uniref:YDG domain-containing protein n=1 Tax=Gonapodya prolifera (strain JEL478) TaxID=1344416 RepID=A0A139AGB6_GONPJ|nr:hypothetical protein M427DRAFT_56407 [Gonapodya prolifera JEL478]|eukprot:KXS15837.1 hypothetical protein M427DRAFT_56407 [Gonapodya prolifera JEL478]
MEVTGDDYVRMREERIRKNRELLELLNIPKIVAPPSPPPTPKTPKNRKRSRAGASNDSESEFDAMSEEDDDAPVKRSKSVKKPKQSTAVPVPATPETPSGSRRSSRPTSGMLSSPASSRRYDPSPVTPATTPIKENTYGAIPGIPYFKTWEYRADCGRDGIHRMIVGGIHGDEETGAYSVALSGGYEDDVDLGEAFTYTGQGGRDLSGTKENPKNLRTGEQSKDQELIRGNLALYQSVKTKNPIRVIRGFKLKSKYAPTSGYRYDGLYTVEKAWSEPGMSGFLVWKFALKRIPGQPPIPINEDFKS